MTATIKLASNTVTLGASANTVFSASVVQITNANTTTSSTITQTSNASVQIGTIVIPPLQWVSLIKAPTDTLTSSLTALVTATSIAYTN